MTAKDLQRELVRIMCAHKDGPEFPVLLSVDNVTKELTQICVESDNENAWIVLDDYKRSRSG